jgi:hypothetical protein
MKKILCIIISFIFILLTACNTAEPLVLPEEVESPSESSSIPIEESTPAPELSESEPKITDSPLESSETIVDPDFHKNYNMFLYGGTWSDDFNENVQRLTLHNKEYTDSSADKKKTFSYNGSDVQLVYQETIERFNDKCHVYKSEQGVEVWYDIKTNQLLFIDDRTFDVTGLTANEEECKNLAEKLIQKMMGVSLSDYTYSCETWYAKNFGEYQGVESKLVPYFHVMKEYQEELSDTGELLSYTEELLSYTFIYTRYIDGYKTSVYISVEFLNNEFATGVIIRFDKSEFTNVVDIDLEYEDAKAAVESFCRAYFSDDREVISVDIEDCCLTFIEDKMYLDCSVVIECSHKDRSYGILESILIEIE